MSIIPVAFTVLPPILFGWCCHAEGFEQVTGQVTDQADELLQFCAVPRSTKEMMQYLGLSHREHFRDTFLLPLIASGKLAPTIPDKPSIPNQRYITVKPEASKPNE
ncbi:MAG: hypothetical protein Q7U66_09730 [Methylobacter sp.]|nr:hypothetical protein [Methylobacter sp.]